MKLSKRYLFVMTFGFLAFVNLIAQLPAGVGLNNDPRLNKAESTFMNRSYKNKGGFNFRNKRIGFVSVYDRILHQDYRSSKYQYFQMFNNKKKFYSELIILTLNEKKRLKYYDGLILFSKQMIEQKNRLRSKSIDLLIEREKNNPTYLYKMGLNSDKFLNSYETDYFNNKFETDFNFKNKMIGYLYYDNDGVEYYQTKLEYFNKLKRKVHQNQFYSNDRVIFHNNTMIESGDYDAIIVSGSKVSKSRANQSRLTGILGFIKSFFILLLIISVPVVLGTLVFKLVARSEGVKKGSKSSVLIVILSSIITIILISISKIPKILEKQYFSNDHFSIIAFIPIFILNLLILTILVKILWRVPWGKSLNISFKFAIPSSIVIYLIIYFASIAQYALS